MDARLPVPGEPDWITECWDRAYARNIGEMSAGEAAAHYGEDVSDLVLKVRQLMIANTRIPDPTLAAVVAERDALLLFKKYVHKRLDDAGVTVDPESPHKAEGCRIGGRLDEVLGQRDAALTALAKLPKTADGVPLVPGMRRR